MRHVSSCDSDEACCELLYSVYLIFTVMILDFRRPSNVLSCDDRPGYHAQGTAFVELRYDTIRYEMLF